jgi:hypothetical protein
MLKNKGFFLLLFSAMPGYNDFSFPSVAKVVMKSILDSILKCSGEKMYKIHVLGSDSDPDPAKWCGSGPSGSES